MRRNLECGTSKQKTAVNANDTNNGGLGNGTARPPPAIIPGVHVGWDQVPRSISRFMVKFKLNFKEKIKGTFASIKVNQRTSDKPD